MLLRLDTWRPALLQIAMHLLKAFPYTMPQFLREWNDLPTMNFRIKQRSLGDGATQHLLQAHTFCTQLHFICRIILGSAFLFCQARNH